MSRLSKGEREFVSDFSGLKSTQPPASSTAAPLQEEPPLPTVAGMAEIDARGISPPLPLLRAHRALRAIAPGQDLRVITSYAQSLGEFQALARHVTRYELLSQEVLDDEFVHVLRRRG